MGRPVKLSGWIKTPGGSVWASHGPSQVVGVVFLLLLIGGWQVHPDLVCILLILLGLFKCRAWASCLLVRKAYAQAVPQ